MDRNYPYNREWCALKLFYSLLASILVLVLSGIAVADPVQFQANDPKIIPEAAGSAGMGGPQPGIIGPDLMIQFTSPSGDSGDFSLAGLPPVPDNTNCQVNNADIFDCDFTNASGQTLQNLLLTISPGGDVVTCGKAFGFMNCKVIQPGGTTTPTIVFFSDGDILDGQGLGFVVEGWNAKTEFDGTFNTPEPNLRILLLVGILVAILSIRLRQSQRQPPVSSDVGNS